MIIEKIKESIDVKLKIIEDERIIEEIFKVFVILKNAGTIFFAGNGGSAADCQHLATELMVKFQKERKGIKAISLTADTCIVTAISNDYSFEWLFARQIETLGEKEDVLFVISTSGNSINLINAVNKAKEKGIKTIALLGKGGGNLKKICDNYIIIPSNNTARIQECHIMIGHILCELIENAC